MNYKKIIEDFASGEINRNHWQLAFDKDGGSWDYIGPELKNDAIRDGMCTKMATKYGTPDGYQDLVELAKAAGINAEWC